MSLTINNLYTGREDNEEEEDDEESKTSDSLMEDVSMMSQKSQPSQHELTLCGMRTMMSTTHYHECHNRMCLCNSPPPQPKSRRISSCSSSGIYRAERRLVVDDLPPHPPLSSNNRMRVKIRLESPDIRTMPPPKPPRTVRASSVSSLLTPSYVNRIRQQQQQRSTSPFTYIETTSIHRKKQPSPLTRIVCQSQREQMSKTTTTTTRKNETRHKTVIFHKLNNTDDPLSPPSRYSSSINLIGFNRIIPTNHVLMRLI